MNQKKNATVRNNKASYMCFIVALVIAAIDQISKNYFQSILQSHNSINIFGTQFFKLILVYNSRAAFSIATGQTWIITLIALGMIVFIIKLVPKVNSLWWIVAFGFILGGAVGNLIDRIFRAPALFQGKVIDFISVGFWPVFNFADSAICIGAACLVCANFFSEQSPLTHKKKINS